MDQALSRRSLRVIATLAALGLAGCGDVVDVRPLPPAQLAFTAGPPAEFEVLRKLPAISVAIQDTDGRTVTTATNAVTATLGANPGGGTLLGTTTVSAVNGVATFTDLVVNKTGSGYTLVAQVPNLAQATSAGFSIRFPLVALTARNTHTCALTASGAAYCWGDNSAGQLGNPNSGSARNAPVPVDGNLELVALSAGSFHTCGLTSDGAALCWGSNSVNQLGGGTTEALSAVPVPVTGGLVFDSLTAGSSHTCGLTQAGVAHCWGWNQFGQLGDGSAVASSASPVPVAGNLTFSALSAGSLHTCGLTTAGAAHCWGFNRFGQLGNGESGIGNQSRVPVPVTGGNTFARVSGGGNHTCGVTTAGEAFCWGQNSSRQLGSVNPDRNTPERVTTNLTFTTVSAGSDHTCGLIAGGSAFCWGANQSGQLGAVTGIVNNTFPVAVEGAGLTFVAIDAARQYTCGVTPGETAFCWGHNDIGQLGDGTQGTDRFAPVGVSDP